MSAAASGAFGRATAGTPAVPGRPAAAGHGRAPEGGLITVLSGTSLAPSNSAAWDAFVAAAPNGHLMQTSRWAALKLQFGWDVERVVLRDGETIRAGAQVMYRALPHGLAALAYVPMGPVVDWANQEQAEVLLAALTAAARRRRAFCLKIEPGATGEAAAGQAARVLAGCGFQPSPQKVQWRSTIMIDLAPAGAVGYGGNGGEDDLLARFSKKHRQKIHKAARAGVVITEGGAEAVPAMWALMGETGERKDFAVYPLDYYRMAYHVFSAQGAGVLLRATYEGTLLAALMVFIAGSTAYCMFAASGNAHRDLMPAYLLHAEGIRWARDHGCLVYDYCGIPDEVGEDPEAHAHDDRTDGLWGVYRFKRGFGGEVVSYTASHDQVYRRSLYSLYNWATDLLYDRLGAAWNRKLFRG